MLDEGGGKLHWKMSGAVTWHVHVWMSGPFIQRPMGICGFGALLWGAAAVLWHPPLQGNITFGLGLSLLLPGQVPCRLSYRRPGGPGAPTWLNSSSTSCSLSSRALGFWKQHERALTSELRSGWIKPSILTETFRPGPDFQTLRSASAPETVSPLGFNPITGPASGSGWI